MASEDVEEEVARGGHAITLASLAQDLDEAIALVPPFMAISDACDPEPLFWANDLPPWFGLKCTFSRLLGPCRVEFLVEEPYRPQ